jgi:hypothetical protein
MYILNPSNFLLLLLTLRWLSLKCWDKDGQGQRKEEKVHILPGRGISTGAKLVYSEQGITSHGKGEDDTDS